MQKVLIVGNVLEVGRTEEVYGRGFSALGCEVKHFTWLDAEPNLFSRCFVQKVTSRLAWQLIAKAANQKLIEIANQFQPDLVFVVAPKLIQPSSIQALKQHSLVFVFFTDNPLDKHHTHSNSWVRQGLTLWDAVFIWSQELTKQLIKQGVKHAYFHSFCSDTQYHFPQQTTDSIYDVAFIGNWDDSRKREKYLKEISHYNLGIWGSKYWNTHCREASIQVCYKGMCSYVEIPKILGSAKIALNILRPQNESGHNIRTFEIPATGTLMLSERSQELLKLFEEDREAVYFSTSEELSKKICYLFENKEVAQFIACRGYEKASQEIVQKRINEVVNFFELSKTAKLKVSC